MMLDFCSLFCAAGVLAVVALFVVFLLAKFSSGDAIPVTYRYKKEQEYIDPETSELKKFSFLSDKPEVTLSIVVPSYNEEERLPQMLDETFEYLANRQAKDKAFTYEIIVVDDGSKDKTSKVALDFGKKNLSANIRVLTLFKNRGKGGAVRMGVFNSRGKLILFVDADGATRFSDLDQVEKGLLDLTKKNNDFAISIGSRAHLQDEAVANRSLLRNFLMFGFHFLVDVLCVKGIRDTQCGFKLFTRQAAMKTFSSLHVERWAFDVELLYLAQQMNIPIAEVAVNWQEMDGSKMIPLFSWLQMGKDLLLIRLRYVIGAWQINKSSKPNCFDI